MENYLNKVLDYIYENKSVYKNNEIELECRFGKYIKIVGNINESIFFKIYKIYKSKTSKFLTIKDEYINNGTIRSHYNFEKDTSSIFSINKYNNITEIIKKINKTNPINTLIIKKEKPFKPFESENMKLDCSIEVKQEKTKTTQPQYTKYKFRCSIINIWNIDMTILQICETKTKSCEIFYEIELEFNYEYCIKNNISRESIINDFNDKSNTIINVIDCDTDTLNLESNFIESEIKYSILNQVSTLEAKSIYHLENSPYSLTEKADGSRQFLYIDSKNILYNINPTSTIIIKNKIAIIKSNHINTVIDGEMLNNEFLAFDLLFFKGKDYRNFGFYTRIEKLKEVIIDLLNCKTNIKFKVKQFYTDKIFTKASEIWTNRTKLFNYNLDGLIFTPILGAYKSNLPILKWKDKHSIDIRILYNQQYNFTEFHPNAHPYTKKGTNNISNSFTTKSGEVVYLQKIQLSEQKYKHFNLVNNNGFLGITGKLIGAENLPSMENIIEVEYDSTKKKWVFLRIRDDKDKPNAYRTIISVLNAITDDITIEKLSKLKYKPSPFSQINKVECYSDMGFNFKEDQIIDDLKDNFYNNEFSDILKNVKTSLLIGCNKNILSRLTHLTKIVILEPNCLEVYGEEKSEGYIGLIEYSNKLGIKNKTHIEWSPIDKKLITKLQKKKFDLIIISNMGSVQFKENLEYFKTIANHIIYIYYNINSFSKLETCIISKNRQQITLYKLIYDKSKQIVTEYNQNYFIKSFDIQLIPASKSNNILNYYYV